MEMTREAFELIDQVIDRAEAMGLKLDTRLNSSMDVKFAYKEFNIDLQAWLDADDLNFEHDYVGIYQNIDRTTKTFGYFVPRFVR